MGVVVPNPTVTEVDGSPSITNVKKVVFSNGTVTADGRIATIVNSGGGGSGVTSVSGTAPVSSTGGTTPAISLDDGGVTTDKLAADAVTNAKIADDAVETANLVADAVTNAKLADDAVETANLAADAVTNAKLADDAVDTANLAADAVTNAKLADDAVETANIATFAVGVNEIAINAVTSSRLNANAVETDKITDQAVTPVKLDKSAGGTAGATTFYRGDGAWATPASGGTDVFNVKLMDTALDTDDQDYDSWPLMMMPPYGHGQHATAKVIDKATFFPFISPVSGDVNRMYWKNTSVATATDPKVFMGFYSNGTGNIPTDLLGYATVDSSISGASSTYSFSATISLVAGTQYWFAVCRNGTTSAYDAAFAGCRAQYVPTIAPQSTIRESYVSQCVTTNSGVTELSASYDKDDLEPGFSFSDMMNAPNIGVEFS